MQDPILATIPDRFETERLLIRVPQAGDGPDVNAAIMDSLDTLRHWMTWARDPPSVTESEANCRRARAQFELREAIALRLYLKGTSTVIGSGGFPRLDWSVPKFEMSYWIRSQYQGRGYATEAVRAIVAYAASHLCAKRVEISMDIRNIPSRRVAERCGFQLEGIQRCSKRDVDGNLCDMCWYGRVIP